MRAIRLDGAQHSQSGAQVVVGKCHARIVGGATAAKDYWLRAASGDPKV
jgi:hypothetical protein